MKKRSKVAADKVVRLRTFRVRATVDGETKLDVAVKMHISPRAIRRMAKNNDAAMPFLAMYLERLSRKSDAPGDLPKVDAGTDDEPTTH